jgi:hypothetical protein
MGWSSAQGAQVRRELSASVRILATASELLYCGDGNERSMTAAVARDIAQASLFNKTQVRASASRIRTRFPRRTSLSVWPFGGER